MAKTFKVKLIKSVIGSNSSMRATVKGLGLSKMNSSVTLKDTPSIRGMIFKAKHLLKVEVNKNG
ncbi:MAG: 50S ribosomal protein L30 [Oligoflexia bacterium]|nr:50S ribosomal protein L30 [Oligoflexia bacterium]